MPELDRAPARLRALINDVPFRNPKGISGTDIKRIMAGDWPALYLEKTGQVEPEPLTDLAPLLGKYLEGFHRDWYIWQTGNDVTSVHANASIPLDHCDFLPNVTLDGIITTEPNSTVRIPWEAKTVGQFIKRDDLIEREFPQLQWQMLCTDADSLELSVMFLNQRWEAVRIERDDEAIEKLVDMAKQFWQHITDGVMPQEQVVTPITPIVERFDMRANADWRTLEATWLKTRQPAKQFQQADKNLKKLIPPEAKNGFGEAISFTRNKAGAVTLLPLTKQQREELPPHE